MHMHTRTAFQEAYQEDFKYSDFFRDQQLWSQHIGDIRREFICCGLDLGLEISSSSFNPSQLRPIQELQSFIPTEEGNRELQELSELQELQSFEPRYENTKNTQKHHFSLHFQIL